MAAVPEDDLPDTLKGKAVPADDLPMAAPAVERPAENEARRTGIKPVGDLRKSMTPQMRMADAGEQAKGMGEAGLNMAVNAIAAPIAGGVGVKDVVTNLLGGKSFDDSMAAGAEGVNKVQGAASKIVPQNKYAQGVQQQIAKPFEMANSALGQGAKYVAESQGANPNQAMAAESTGENLLPVASVLFGGPSAVKGGAAAVNSAKQAVKSGIGQAQDAVLRAKGWGYKAIPSEANPTVGNKVAGAIANTDKLADEIAVTNAKVTTDLVKDEIGIPKNKFLNAETLKPIKDAASVKYDAIKNLKDVVLSPDDTLAQDLGAANTNPELVSTQPDYYRTPKFERVRAEILQPARPWTPKTLLDHIANLRQDANTLFKRAGAKPEDHRQATAMRNVANSLEDFLERKLSTDVYTGGDATAASPKPQGILPGQPNNPKLPGRSQVTQYSNVGPEVTPMSATPSAEPTMGQMPNKHGGTMEHTDNSGRVKMINDWKEARKTLAKIHDIEAVTNLETGHVDPAKLAKIADDGGKLTGNFEKIVQAHKAMPHVVKSVEKGSQSALRAGDATVGNAILKGAHTLAGGAAGASAGAAFGHVGAAAGAIGGLALPLAARKLMAGLMNEYMSNPTPGLLQKIAKIDPKTAAGLAASAAGRTNSQLPPPMEQQK